MPQRRRVFTAGLIGAGILCVAAFLPLPWYLMAPGAAVDLSAAISVGSTATPRDRFFLTDVQLMRASPLRLAYALVPGVTLTHADLVVPKGVSSGRFDDIMQSAMIQSQTVAAIVAERAAGFAVPVPAAHVEVEAVDAASAARGVLAVGDVIRAVDRVVIRGGSDVRTAVSTKQPGAAVRIAFERAGHARREWVRTVELGGSTRLGVILGERYGSAHLAVPVRFALGDVGGSSGGLMMALRIYASLRAPAPGDVRSFAGTGTIGLDGRVGAIEGTQQKLIAAKRAGAHLFFVPRANFSDIATERDVRIVPVDTFAQAVRVLDERPQKRIGFVPVAAAMSRPITDGRSEVAKRG